MEKLTLDTGLRSYRINGGGVLRFNPADPNLYARFLEAMEKIKAMEDSLPGTGEDSPLENMCRTDKQIKQLLGWVFAGNDFDGLLGGVNLLAVATNGERVITNLLQTLLPVLTEGAQLCAGVQVDKALAQAKLRREQL